MRSFLYDVATFKCRLHDEAISESTARGVAFGESFEYAELCAFGGGEMAVGYVHLCEKIEEAREARFTNFWIWSMTYGSGSTEHTSLSNSSKHCSASAYGGPLYQLGSSS